VLVVTGDGEMLMGLGSLATIGAMRPANLAVAVFDNGRYGETGMQRSHTDKGVALAGVARACGFAEVSDIAMGGALEAFARRLHEPGGPLFARVTIAAAEAPRVLPPRDGVFLKTRFRRALGVEAM
jgi:thiamine pyrophosphate-dependent acetolactate synthase large subunit-like protein